MYHINIKPKPTPRPRQGVSRKTNKKTFYYPAEYVKYKNNLLDLISNLYIPKKDYKEIWVTFGVPYPKQVKGGKKAKIESQPMRNKFDCDNVLKGFMDALEQAKVIEDDRQIYITHTAKLWTCTSGYIKFDLE